MSSKRATSELDFAEFVRCPLRAQTAGYREGFELEAAKEAVKIVLAHAFDNRILSLPDVRSTLDRCWRSLEGLGDAERIAGLRILPRIASRIHDLVTGFEVTHAVVNYMFEFGRNSVCGEYAALHRKDRPQETQVLRLRFNLDQQTEVKRVDTVNMLRWLHFRTFEGTLPLVRVLNWSLDKDEQWTDFYDEKVVKGYLNSVSLNIADNRLFPSPGDHCSSCRVPLCTIDGLEAFHG